MPIDPEKRAETARANGAKSNGPNTKEGRDRCARAATESARRRRAIAVTLDCTLLPNESRELLLAQTQHEFAYWQPSSPMEIQLVQELIDINWKIRRIRFSQNHALIEATETQRQRASAPELAPALVAQAVAEGCVPSGPQTNLDRAANLLTATRSRILRDLRLLNRTFPNRAGSQPVLQTEHLTTEFSFQVPAEPQTEVPTAPATPLDYATDPETLIVDPAEPEEPTPSQPGDILTWAQQQLDFHPDAPQTDIMTSESKDILVLGSRQTGKSTAAALRALYEALNDDGSTVLLAGPSGRQSGHIMTRSREFAQQLGLTLGAPPPGCDGYKLPNGSKIISLPDNNTTVRGFSAPRLIIVDEAAFASDELITALRPMLAVSDGRMMLLTTPNGQSGYFYEKWHEQNDEVHKILCRADQCTRIDAKTLAGFRASMTTAEYAQEFDCQFQAEGTEGIPRETFRKNISSDIKPMFEEYNE